MVRLLVFVDQQNDLILFFFFSIVHPAMKLEENCASDRSWLYKTPVDFSDGSTGGEELLAVRFPSVESKYSFIIIIF